MPGDVNCIYTKVLIPYLERNVGPQATEVVCRAAGRSRDYLMADHNWIPLDLANELMRLGQELMGEPDAERWARGFWEFGMDWKPREERSYMGTWSMAIGDPRTAYERTGVYYPHVHRHATPTIEELAKKAKPGSLLYKEPPLAIRLIREEFTKEYRGVVIDAPTLFEEVRFDRSSVTSIDWASYPILEIQDAPESIEVVLINRPEVAPTGAGEPTIRCIPAAVANAFFDATGVRLRRAPLAPERVKAALARA